MDESGQAVTNEQGIDDVLHCCTCSRIFKLPSGSGVGSIITCPFCNTTQKLRTMTVYVSDPLVEA
jgi:hypothetical protein